MKNLRKEFPVLSQYTYLNTASSGLLYDSLLNFRQEHDLDFLIGGSIFRERQAALLTSVRKTIGRFFNASPKETVLVQNFSHGLNILLDGIDKSKKILLLADDYPSVNFAVTSKGFDVCYAEINEYLEKNIEEAMEHHKPAVVAFSLVQYLNGVAVDLHFIKQLKSKHPDLLIIADGSQFCGTVDFDFKNSGIDILGTTGYKWLLGGYGTGFFLFNDGVLDKITPVSYTNSAKEATHDLSYTKQTARFECGHLDTFAFGSLQHSLQFLSNIGMKNIEAHIKELSAYATNKFAELNLLETAVLNRSQHSGILTIKGDKTLFDSLKSKNIITTLRPNGIRISIHFYTTKEDIDTLIASLSFNR